MYIYIYIYICICIYIHIHIYIYIACERCCGLDLSEAHCVFSAIAWVIFSVHISSVVLLTLLLMIEFQRQLILSGFLFV